MKATKLEYWISTIIFFLILLSVIIMTNTHYSSELLNVKITTEQGTEIFPLSHDKIITVDGPVGKTVIEIIEHKVHVIKSDCRNQICKNTGFISRPGQIIACVPNKVIVELVKHTAGEINVITK